MRVAAGLALLVALAGCGGGTTTGPPVRLTIESPSDLAVSHDSTIALTGRVAPAGASVEVEGRPVRVAAGRFSTTVALEPGTNIVDVLAGRRGSRAALVALRVRREVDVRVPELSGASPSDADDALAGLGLKAQVKKAGGIIELLLPEDARVCRTDPPAGSLVAPGTTVAVHVAKIC
jgi:Glucodextranase, domain B/PASTA domain